MKVPLNYYVICKILKWLVRVGDTLATRGLAAISATHFDNMPMQYTVNFNGCKNDNFQLKMIYILLVFAQNRECWYMLEPPQQVPTIFVFEQK